MLLECRDVNLSRSDSQYGRAPLPLAAEHGREGVVKMLWERNDVCTSTPDNKNQSPLLLAPSEGYDRVARILREPGNVNSAATDCSGQASPPSTGHRVVFAVEMQPACDHNTDTTDLTWQPALSSAERNEREVVSDLKHPVPKSIESDISPTEPPGLSQPPATGPLEKIETHPRATKSTLSFSVYWCFVVSSLICLFAFFLYIFPSPLFYKYLQGRE